MKKIIYFVKILILIIFIPSCGLNSATTSLKNLRYDKIYYTVEQYKKTHKRDFIHKNDEMYLGLKLEDLKLLGKPYCKATEDEIQNDIAYNKTSILLDRQYTKIIDYLIEDVNLIKLTNHLNYKKNNIKLIVFNGNKAIILFIGSSSYESFLIALDKDYLRIKLIGYLYG